MVLMSFTELESKTLMAVATASIEHGLTHHRALTVNPEDYSPKLREERVSFVTLKIQGQLRGCMGALVATRPLISDVAIHAYAAAFSDPRFASLQSSELPQLDVHISVLTVPEPMAFTSEADLIRQLQPGVDGLIIKDGWYRGTFLPAVWEALPEPQEFVRQLKHKAGLPMNHWSDSLTIQRYTAESIFFDTTTQTYRCV